MSHPNNVAELISALEKAGVRLDHVITATTSHGVMPASVMLETDGLLEVTRRLGAVVNGHTFNIEGSPWHIVLTANIDGIEIKSIDFYPREKI